MTTATLYGPADYVAAVRYLTGDILVAQPEPKRRARRADGKPVQGQLWGEL